MSINTYIKKLLKLGYSLKVVTHNVIQYYKLSDADAEYQVNSIYKEFKHDILQDMLLTHKIFKFKDIRFLLKDCYIIDDASDAELKQALKDLG